MPEHYQTYPLVLNHRGLRIRDDDQPLQPGEFRDVDAPNGVIREASYAVTL
jgi:hypothetical protein